MFYSATVITDNLGNNLFHSIKHLAYDREWEAHIRGGYRPYPYDEGKHVLVRIEHFAYLDESGTQGKNAPYCIVGGYVGSSAAWRKFRHDWRLDRLRRLAGNKNRTTDNWDKEHMELALYSLGATRAKIASLES